MTIRPSGPPSSAIILLVRLFVYAIRAPKSAAKREIECLHVKIEELDFEGAVYDWTLLPDQLIESGLSNFAERR